MKVLAHLYACVSGTTRLHHEQVHQASGLQKFSWNVQINQQVHRACKQKSAISHCVANKLSRAW